MYNTQRQVKTTEKRLEGKHTIEIDSEKYNADEAYSKSVTEDLKQLFKNDLNPTL